MDLQYIDTSLPPEKHEFTVADIERLPENVRAELVDGQIYLMATPTVTHQRILRELSRVISDYIDSQQGDCEMFFAPCAVYLNNDDKTYLEPDIFVVCDPDKIDDDGCHGAPDWVIEIASQSNLKMDYFIKEPKYRAAGVREYWVVSSFGKSIVVHNYENDRIEEYNFEESVPVGIYPGFSIDFSGFQI